MDRATVRAEIDAITVWLVAEDVDRVGRRCMCGAVVIGWVLVVLEHNHLVAAAVVASTAGDWGQIIHVHLHDQYAP